MVICLVQGADDFRVPTNPTK